MTTGSFTNIPSSIPVDVPGILIEGIVTTCDKDAKLNIAPMGPIVEESWERLTLRPFKSSKTWRNLSLTREGVFHIVDDVLLLAQAAINCWVEQPITFPAKTIGGQVLKDACRWYEFQVVDILDQNTERPTLQTQVQHSARLGDFLGFQRAKHAVLEVAILASRVKFLPFETIQAQMTQLEIPIAKTGGEREKQAFQLLKEFIKHSHSRNSSGQSSSPSVTTK